MVARSSSAERRPWPRRNRVHDSASASNLGSRENAGGTLAAAERLAFVVSVGMLRRYERHQVGRRRRHPVDATLVCVIAFAISCATRGLAGVPVTVEADIANGLRAFTIVGPTDRASPEAPERVKPAIRNAGFKFPQRRVPVNLAPAELPKEGTGFDLAIAISRLGAQGAW